MGFAKEGTRYGLDKALKELTEGEVSEVVETYQGLVILKLIKVLEARQAVELVTSFLPAPGIDAARNKGLRTWTQCEGQDLYKTYFTRES